MPDHAGASSGPLAPLLDEAGPVFDRLALIGVGLQGGSVARAARLRGDLARTVVGYDASPSARARLRELAILDDVADALPDAVRGADCVMLCAPVGAFAAIAAEMAPHLAPGVIVTDTGSTKLSVIADVAPHIPAHATFVPGHPMAGTEFTGPDAGFPTLFEGRWVVLTPLPGADPAAADRVEAFWRRAGAMVDRMDPAHHDRVVAIVSHLPHLIAFVICGTADDVEFQAADGSEVLKFAATGFRDFTRIASSDPVMWRDVFLNNREALLEMLARFTEDAQAMARAVRWGDGAYIEQRILRGRDVRRSLIEINQA